MTKAVQRRRGSSVQHALFVGLPGEVTVDEVKHTVVVHDGVTPGGHPLALEGAGGVNDHGALTGLGDDDHPQYLKTDGTRALTGDQSFGSHKATAVANGSASTDAVNKGQLDSAAAAAQAAAIAAADAAADAGDAATLAAADAAADAGDAATLAAADVAADAGDAATLSSANAHADAGDTATAALAIPKSIVTQKGDLIIATSSGTPARQPVPSNGSTLIANAAQPNGWTVGDHGGLGGLSDDDHPQYLKADGTRALTGDQSFGSHKATNVQDGAVATDAATKGQLDAGDALSLLKDGTRALTGDQSFGTHKATNLGDGSTSSDAVNKGQMDAGDALAIAKTLVTTKGDVITRSTTAPVRHGVGANGTTLVASSGAADGWINGDHGDLGGLGDDDHTQYTKADGTRAFSGDQSMGTHKLTNVTDGSAATDAATKGQMDTADALSILKDGTRPFTGDQSMGSHKITNVTDPASAQDAATKAYADAVRTPTAPTIVSVSAEFSSTGTPTAILPTGHLADDILVLVLQSANESNIPAPTNYKQIGPQNGFGTAAAAGSSKLSIFWKRDGGSESAPTLGDSGDHTYGFMFAVRGCPTTGDPFHWGNNNWKSTASTTGTSPVSFAGIDNSLVCDIFAGNVDNASAEGSALTNSSLTSLTEQFDDGTTDGVGGFLYMSTGICQSAGGRIGATTVTWANSSSDLCTRIHFIPAVKANRDAPSALRPSETQLFIGSPADLDDTWTRPTEATRVLAAIVDGGGSGSAGRQAATAAGGGGGGGGGYDEAWFNPIDLGVTVTVHAGKGGAATANVDGTAGNAGVLSEFDKGSAGPLTSTRRIAGTAAVGAISTDGGDGGCGSGRGRASPAVATTRIDLTAATAGAALGGVGGRGGSGTTGPTGGSPAEWGGGGGESGADADTGTTSVNNGWSTRGGGGGAGGRSSGTASAGGFGGGANAPAAAAGANGTDSTRLPYGGSGGCAGDSATHAGNGGFPGGGGGGGGTNAALQGGGAGAHGLVSVTSFF